MLLKRVLVAIVLLPIGLAAIIAGGWYLTALVAVFMGVAAWEYVTLFRAGGLQPAGVLVIGGTLLFVLSRNINGFNSAPWMISLFILLSMTYHLVTYEHGRDQAGTDFAVTLAGMFYIGWIGAYFISLRNLPEGLWWILVVLPAVWFADSAAYFIGKRFGRHQLSPRLSPKKTWEGYLGGIIVGVLLTAGFAAILQMWAGADSPITPLRRKSAPGNLNVPSSMPCSNFKSLKCRSMLPTLCVKMFGRSCSSRAAVAPWARASS